MSVQEEEEGEEEVKYGCQKRISPSNTNFYKTCMNYIWTSNLSSSEFQTDPLWVKTKGSTETLVICCTHGCCY